MFRFDRTTLRPGNIIAAVGILAWVLLDLFLKPKFEKLYEGYPVEQFPALSQFVLSKDGLRTYFLLFIALASLYESNKERRVSSVVLNVLIYSFIILTLIGWYWPLFILSK